MDTRLEITTGISADNRVLVNVGANGKVIATVWLPAPHARWLAEDLVLLAYRAEVASGARKSAPTEGGG